MTISELTDEQLSRWLAKKLSLEVFPHDFINDPTMTVMLLEKPGFVDLCYIAEDKIYDATFCGEEEHSVNCGAMMETSQHNKLGRALAQAAALALGWKE